eukprot:TRINITY_DN11946_c0_g1_i1.p1 TRINITY_DN11946_c0_g1~~TRINITY_DN11946_c0_g1_i1.p1  ORF type:complete len:172 (+),score=55.82 TRINITY_DN11946_c0_g1_i1:94-609(+)
MSCDVRVIIFFFFLMIRRPPRSTLSSSSAASDVYKRQVSTQSTGDFDAAWVMGCTMADEQVGGQEKEKRGIVTDKEVVRLFQKIGDPSGGTRKVDVVNMSQVAAWLRRVQGPTGEAEQARVNTLAETTFEQITGSCEETVCTLRQWRQWCAAKRMDVAERRFREWFNMHNV